MNKEVTDTSDILCHSWHLTSRGESRWEFCKMLPLVISWLDNLYMALLHEKKIIFAHVY